MRLEAQKYLFDIQRAAALLVPQDEILADYPDLQPDDIRACIAYAYSVIAGDTLEAVRVG